MSELNHHGIQGQKWGKRRYQNPDGTLTAEGKIRYAKNQEIGSERLKNRIKNAHNTNYHDKLATSLSAEGRIKGIRLHENAVKVENSAKSIMNDPDRLAEFGRRTRSQRLAIIAGTALLTPLTFGLAVAGTAALESTLAFGITMGAAGGVAASGKALYDATKD